MTNSFMSGRNKDICRLCTMNLAALCKFLNRKTNSITDKKHEFGADACADADGDSCELSRSRKNALLCCCRSPSYYFAQGPIFKMCSGTTPQRRAAQYWSTNKLCKTPCHTIYWLCNCNELLLDMDSMHFTETFHLLWIGVDFSQHCRHRAQPTGQRVSFAVNDRIAQQCACFAQFAVQCLHNAHPLEDLIESEGGISLLQHTILIDEGLQVLPGKIALNWTFIFQCFSLYHESWILAEKINDCNCPGVKSSHQCYIVPVSNCPGTYDLWTRVSAIDDIASIRLKKRASVLITF